MRNSLSVVLVCFLFLACKSSYSIESAVVFSRIADEVESQDKEIVLAVEPYKEKLEETMNEVIGELKMELVKEAPESNIGNWLADMMLDEAVTRFGNVDMAIQNQGGIRINSLAPGPLTVGEMFEIMPFDNLLFLLEANADQVQVLFNHIAASGGWPVSRGVHFEIVDRQAANVTLHGQGLEQGRKYIIAIPDYVANGGSGSSFLPEYGRIETDIYIRDLFIEHIKGETKGGRSQEAHIEGRIISTTNE